jgi:hypothetical protein
VDSAQCVVSNDRLFAVPCHPWCDQLTVVLEAEPDGAALRPSSRSIISS